MTEPAIGTATYELLDHCHGNKWDWRVVVSVVGWASRLWFAEHDFKDGLPGVADRFIRSYADTMTLNRHSQKGDFYFSPRWIRGLVEAAMIGRDEAIEKGLFAS